MANTISTLFYDIMFDDTNSSESMSSVERKSLLKVKDILTDQGKLTDQVPILPSMLIKILDTLKDPHADVHSFVEILEKDPTFAVKVLKTANSAKYHRGSSEIRSLQKAISLLGLSGITSIATTLLMADVIPCEPAFYQKFGRQIWVHSLQCANFCQLLAPEYEQQEHEAYFIGLIHDIGKIIIFNCLTITLERAFTLEQTNVSHTPSSNIYIDLMSEMSVELSHYVAKEWQLPQIYIDALQQQTQTPTSPLAILLFQANKLSEAFLVNESGNIDDEGTAELLSSLNIGDDIWLKFAEIAPSIDTSIA